MTAVRSRRANPTGDMTIVDHLRELRRRLGQPRPLGCGPVEVEIPHMEGVGGERHNAGEEVVRDGVIHDGAVKAQGPSVGTSGPVLPGFAGTLQSVQSLPDRHATVY